LRSWTLPALIALILWGFWGFLPKVATRYIDPSSALVYQAIGGTIVGLGVYYRLGAKFNGRQLARSGQF